MSDWQALRSQLTWSWWAGSDGPVAFKRQLLTNCCVENMLMWPSSEMFWRGWYSAYLAKRVVLLVFRWFVSNLMLSLKYFQSMVQCSTLHVERVRLPDALASYCCSAQWRRLVGFETEWTTPMREPVDVYTHGPIVSVVPVAEFYTLWNLQCVHL